MSTDLNEQEISELFVLFCMLRALKESAKQASFKEEIKTIHKQYHKIRRELIDIDESFKSAIPAIMSEAEEVYLLRQVLVGLDQAITVVGILIIPKIAESEKYAKILQDLGLIQTGQPFGKLSAFLAVLGLTNNWAIAASALCLLEILVNRKLKAMGLDNSGDFEKRVKRLDSEAKKKGATIPNLLAPAFYNVRNKVVHGGEEPMPKELEIILEFLGNFFKETARI